MLFRRDTGGLTHGNFLDASFRRIEADPAWAARLAKVYTAARNLSHRVEDALDPHYLRRELDCANSSDALLMNLLCYPGLLARPRVLQLLGLPSAPRPHFGVPIGVPLSLASATRRKRAGSADSRPDRTEIDCRLDDLLLEAKLTETGFQTAPARLVERYRDLHAVFDLDDLPRHPRTGTFLSYQLLRGVLAAHAHGCRFAVLLDRRRPDLAEQWFHVLRAVRSFTLRSRLQLLTWQELAGVVSAPVQRFLESKYGIVA